MRSCIQDRSRLLSSSELIGREEWSPALAQSLSLISDFRASLFKLTPVDSGTRGPPLISNMLLFTGRVDMGLQVRSTVAPVGEAGRLAVAVMLASITMSLAGTSLWGAPPTEGQEDQKRFQQLKNMSTGAVWSSYIVLTTILFNP